jgi:hypothetical protein
LSVYHHHYDAISLFGPLIVYVLGPWKYDRRLIALFAVPVILFAGVYQVAEVQKVFDDLFGQGSSVISKLFGVVSVNVAFLASLLLLSDFIRRRTPSVSR